MRLDKAISINNYYSRKDAKNLIKKGYITVNNNVVKDESFNVTDSDIVMLDDEVIDTREYIYLLLNKPKGYVSAKTDNIYPTVLDLIDEPYRDRLSIVGRLDLDTTGLLILTTDGDMVHKITSPKSNIVKCYNVLLDKELSDEDIKTLEDGIILDGEKLNKSKIEKIDKFNYNYFIDEGKFHQVKRMSSSVGGNVIELNRYSIGSLTCGNLLLGEYQEITKEKLISNLN